MFAFIISHPDELAWVRKVYGLDVHVIVHEDYFSLLLEENLPCFYDIKNEYDVEDHAINFLSFNWYRNDDAVDISVFNAPSIAESFSTGVWINVAAVCREYFALKYWCTKFDTIHISCNENEEFLSIAKTFKNQVQIFDSGQTRLAELSSMGDRVLELPKVNVWVKFFRWVQSPFVRLLKNKTLTLGDWSSSVYASKQSHWISLNSLSLWAGAYTRKPTPKQLLQAELLVPSDFNAFLNPSSLSRVLQRINIHWDDALIVRLSCVMSERYARYHDYFVQIVATYQDLLEVYCPSELVIASEYYEPYVVAINLARARGVKVSWLVDGYPLVSIPKCVGFSSLDPLAFDRIYAIGCQHELRLLSTLPLGVEIVTIPPPILDLHSLSSVGSPIFDIIIMTWIPNDLGMNGRNGARPNTLMEALLVCKEVGFTSIAIKIKHYSEKEWLLPLLKKFNLLSEVTILEGSFFKHVVRTRRVIGGVSSAVGEAANHGIPYYIYEPVANGYSDAQLASAVIIIEGGVARTPDHLRTLLKRPEGSAMNDRELLFGVECLHPQWTWGQTRELYTSWASRWADKSGIKDVLHWRDFPLWWASNLVLKDTAVDYAWYQALHDRLRGMTSSPLVPFANTSVYWGLLKSMVKDIGKWSLLRLLPKGDEPSQHALQSKARVWFHGLEYNFIQAREGFCDRMYEQVPLDDVQHGFASAYVVRLNFKTADFLHPLSWRKKIQAYEGKLQRKVEILDRHLLLTDILGIHASLIKNYFQFTRLAKAWRRQGVRIGHAEFSDILISEMQKSFVNAFPWSLSYGAMFERWLQKSNTPKTLVTYGETLAPMRPVYFATQKQPLKHQWISIQHATIYKNKMGFYHHHSEFNRAGAEDKRNISPMPDYYFVHGTQFADILSSFYPPDRIRVTGCLKYDSLFRIYGQGRTLPQQGGTGRVLLLAPSVGDEEIILKMLTGLQTLPGWRVMLSKHPTVSREWIDELIQRNGIALKIEFDPTKSTAQLMESASLVVCSYSGIALESFFVGVPSVRVLNPGQPPVVEDEPGLAYVTTQQELLHVISGLESGKPWAGLTAEISATLERYFYKFDGLASMRFWTALGQLNDLPLKHSAQV